MPQWLKLVIIGAALYFFVLPFVLGQLKKRQTV